MKQIDPIEKHDIFANSWVYHQQFINRARFYYMKLTSSIRWSEFSLRSLEKYC